MKTLIAAVYAGYYGVMLVAYKVEHDVPGNRWSPGLFLLILALHFVIGVYETFKREESDTIYAWLTKRYCTARWQSVVAIALDVLLSAALIVAILWMQAAVRSERTWDLFVATFLLAGLGNAGCVVLRFDDLTTNLGRTSKQDHW